MENSSSKALLSPRLCVANVGNAKRSSSLQISSDSMSSLTTNSHSKLRTSRSFDNRTAANATYRFETESSGYRDEIARPGAATSYITHDPALQQQHQPTEPHQFRVQSARDRPQSAWKSRRHGRQPNFTFTDFGGRVTDGGRGCSSGTRTPACHPDHQSSSIDLNDVESQDLMHRLRLTADDGSGANGDDGGDDAAIHTRQPSGYRHDVGTGVQAQQPLNSGTASGYDRRRRHSLYAPPPSIEISEPMQATIFDHTPTPSEDSSSFSGEQVFLDGGRSSRLGNASPDETNGIDDGLTSFRNRALTDGEHSAARQRVLARLTGVAADNCDEATASNTYRTQLPRKLNPLFRN